MVVGERKRGADEVKGFGKPAKRLREEQIENGTVGVSYVILWGGGVLSE